MLWVPARPFVLYYFNSFDGHNSSLHTYRRKYLLKQGDDLIQFVAQFLGCHDSSPDSIMHRNQNLI